MYRFFTIGVMSLSLLGCGSNDVIAPPHSVEQHQPNAIASSKWNLVWQDEFEGTSIDSNKWSVEQNCFGGGNSEQQCYTNKADNAYVADGLLHIVAKKEVFTGAQMPENAADYSIHQRKTQPFTSARLNTKNKGDWLYGRIEVRAKLPKGQGGLSAITMLPTDETFGPWPLSGEITIMDAVNIGAVSDDEHADKNELEQRIYAALHYGGLPPDNQTFSLSYKRLTDLSPADEFNVYAIEWEPGIIRWYINDVIYAARHSSRWYTGNITLKNSLPRHAPFEQRFYLALYLAVGGDWAAKANSLGVDESTYPQAFVVDFVRVYQRL